MQGRHNQARQLLAGELDIYFYDTELACALLGIGSSEQLDLHPLRGSLFENLIITELIKHRFNQGKPVNFFLWRDNTANEIDVILEGATTSVPVEIKSGKTITSLFNGGLALAKIEWKRGWFYCI